MHQQCLKCAPYIVEALPDMRWFTPSTEYAPKQLQRLFIIRDTDGIDGEMWLDVHPGSSLQVVCKCSSAKPGNESNEGQS